MQQPWAGLCHPAAVPFLQVQMCAPRAQTCTPGGVGDTCMCRAVQSRQGAGGTSSATTSPSQGPGVTAAGIFSSDMCHLSCRRGGGWQGEALAAATRRLRSPAHGVPHRQQSPVPLWARSLHPGTGTWGVLEWGAWGPEGALWLCWQPGWGPSAGRAIFRWEWMVVAAARALREASSPPPVAGEVPGRVAVGTGTVRPAVCWRVARDFSMALALAPTGVAVGPGWLLCGHQGHRPLPVGGGHGSGGGGPWPLFLLCCLFGRGALFSVPRFPHVQSRD